VSGSQRFTAFSRRSVSWSNSSHLTVVFIC
jgi:hypothetical protein